MEKAITYVGLDVHKDTIAVALAEAGIGSDVRKYGKTAHTPAASKVLTAKLTHGGHRAGRDGVQPVGRGRREVKLPARVPDEPLIR